MPVTAPKDSSIDVGLPTLPLKCDDPKVNTELGFIYQALRNLQAAMNGDSFSAYLPAQQFVSSGVNTKVTLSAEAFDTGSKFDSVTNYRFQPGIPGDYQINWALGCLGAAGTLTLASSMLRKNGVVNKYGGFFSGPAASAQTEIIVTGSALIFLDITDYLELFGTVGATNPQFDAGASITYLTGHLVRRRSV